MILKEAKRNSDEKNDKKAKKKKNEKVLILKEAERNSDEKNVKKSKKKEKKKDVVMKEAELDLDKNKNDKRKENKKDLVTKEAEIDLDKNKKEKRKENKKDLINKGEKKHKGKVENVDDIYVLKDEWVEEKIETESKTKVSSSEATNRDSDRKKKTNGDFSKNLSPSNDDIQHQKEHSHKISDIIASINKSCKRKTEKPSNSYSIINDPCFDDKSGDFSKNLSTTNDDIQHQKEHSRKITDVIASINKSCKRKTEKPSNSYSITNDLCFDDKSGDFSKNLSTTNDDVQHQKEHSRKISDVIASINKSCKRKTEKPSNSYSIINDLCFDDKSDPTLKDLTPVKKKRKFDKNTRPAKKLKVEKTNIITRSKSRKLSENCEVSEVERKKLNNCAFIDNLDFLPLSSEGQRFKSVRDRLSINRGIEVSSVVSQSSITNSLADVDGPNSSVFADNYSYVSVKRTSNEELEDIKESKRKRKKQRRKEKKKRKLLEKQFRQEIKQDKVRQQIKQDQVQKQIKHDRKLINKIRYDR